MDISNLARSAPILAMQTAANLVSKAAHPVRAAYAKPKASMQARVTECAPKLVPAMAGARLRCVHEAST